MTLVPIAFHRPPCQVTLMGKPTTHRFEEKYLQNPCSSAQSPRILLSVDGPYIEGEEVGGCPGNELCIQSHPRRL